MNELFDETAIETPRRKRAELILALHQKMLKSMVYTLIFSMTVPVALYFIPLLNYFGAHPAPIVAGLLGYPFISHLLLLGLPICLGGDMYSKWINSNIYYSQYADEAYLAYTFYDPKLQPLYMPNLDKRKGNLFLGYSTVTDEMVILKESDLKLGIMIIGAVGTGKTSTIFKPIAQQLIQKQIYFIRDYHMLKEKGILFDRKGGANYVAGFARQMGIPEKIINHIKPHDPNTRSINVMHGDVLEVVNLLLEVLTPAVKKSDFFVQSERDYLRLRTYLEKYTTLVKQADENKRAQEAGETPNIIEPSLEELFQFVTDSKKTYDATVGINNIFNIFARLNVAYAKYITEIRKQITALEGKGNLSKDQQTQLRDLEKDMREIKMQQAIVTSIKTLLTNNYQVTERDPTFFAEDNAGQKVPLKDMTQQYVRKLLNTFNELHSNPSVYRILFQVNAPLNIADIFFTTGINLYETGNQGKENSREVSELIGRIEFILHNHGLYSRPANVSPMVPMIADEFASYYYADIGQVFNKIRKNNGPYIIATQTGSA